MAFEFEDVQSPLVEQMKRQTSRMYSKGMVKISPSGCVLPAQYKKFARRVKDFEVRDDDVWVVTYPKCGTTWTQELVWLLLNDLDFDRAKKELLEARTPFLELWAVTYPEEEEEYGTIDTIEYTESLPSPRCIKSHLPKDLLPDGIWTKKNKVVYVTRNPKDVVVSFYNHHQLINGYTGTLDEFVDSFLAEDILYWGSYWKHILEFWKLKDDPNVLINSFEEMKKDLPGVIRRTAKFLGKSVTEEQVAELAEHLSFKNMKDNPAVNFETFTAPLRKKFNITNKFMRSGEVGSAVKHLSSEQIERLDKWSRERVAGTDYPFVG